MVVPTQFVLPAAPHEGVVVNVAAMRIFYYPPHKKGEPQVVFTHPIGIGKVGWKTPEGTTKIVSRQKDPVWVVPKSVRDEHAEDGEKLPAQVPAGPDNPLGAVQFRLSWPSYLIHGTNKPYGVGMRSSHGCMRLYPEDIAVFYDLIPIGTKVTVVNQPYLFGWRDGTLYLQAYTVMEDDSRDWSKNRKRLLAKLLSPKLQKKIARPRQRNRLAAGRRSGAHAARRARAHHRRSGRRRCGDFAARSSWRTRCPRAPIGTARPDCWWTRRHSRNWSAAAPKRRPRRRPKLPFADDRFRGIGWRFSRWRAGAARWARFPAIDRASMITPSPMSISFGSLTSNLTCGSMCKARSISGTATLEFKRLDPRATQLVLDTKDLMITT